MADGELLHPISEPEEPVPSTAGLGPAQSLHIPAYIPAATSTLACHGNTATAVSADVPVHAGSSVLRRGQRCSKLWMAHTRYGQPPFLAVSAHALRRQAEPTLSGRRPIPSLHPTAVAQNILSCRSAQLDPSPTPCWRCAGSARRLGRLGRGASSALLQPA